ncbi:MAG: tyrosine-type recombinase/integrase [bacterium]
MAKVRPATKARAIRKGRQRRVVYMLAVWTGLRRGEIRELRWGDVQLDTAPGRITLRAQATKSKRADTLPLHPQLADVLRKWRPADAESGEKVVSTVPNMKCLRADLALAEIPEQDEAGRYVDFHSLRVSLSTLLAAHKVSPRAAQALMRHTDPRLTASVYTDERLLPLAAELQNVPEIPAAAESENSGGAEAQVESLVAGLSGTQKEALLAALSRSMAG